MIKGITREWVEEVETLLYLIGKVNAADSPEEAAQHLNMVMTCGNDINSKHEGIRQ